MEKSVYTEIFHFLLSLRATRNFHSPADPLPAPQLPSSPDQNPPSQLMIQLKITAGKRAGIPTNEFVKSVKAKGEMLL
jgi:hypothetical protein